MSKYNKSFVKNILKENGFKSTDIRETILSIFLDAVEPLDANAISKKLSKSKNLKDTNEVTVYRNLAALEEAGIVRRVDLRKDSLYFELTENHHHHIVCTSCSAIEDFESSEIEKLLDKVKAQSSKFKNIQEHSLELFGLCAKCA